MNIQTRLYLSIAKSLWRRVKISGQENLPTHGPYVVAANHSGFLDGPVLAAVVFVTTGQKAHFITTPWVWQRFQRLSGRRGLSWLGMTPIDQTHPTDCLNTAQQYLKQGGVVAIFPEGRRNNSSILLKGKTGAVRLALSIGCPVIPAGIKASAGAWGQALWHLIARKPISVSFGQPIIFTPPAAPPDKATLHNLTDQIMRAVAPLADKHFSEDA